MYPFTFAFDDRLYVVHCFKHFCYQIKVHKFLLQHEVLVSGIMYHGTYFSSKVLHTSLIFSLAINMA